MSLSLELFKKTCIVISISYNKMQITRLRWLFVRQQINGILLHGYDVILETFLYLKRFQLCLIEKSWGSF